MVTDVNPVQPEKALKFIIVTEFGMVTDVKLLQFSKALPPIVVTPSSIITVVIEKRELFHGTLKFNSISPVPLIVSTPSSNIAIISSAFGQPMSHGSLAVPLPCAFVVIPTAHIKKRKIKIRFIV